MIAEEKILKHLQKSNQWATENKNEGEGSDKSWDRRKDVFS